MMVLTFFRMLKIQMTKRTNERRRRTESDRDLGTERTEKDPGPERDAAIGHDPVIEKVFYNSKQLEFWPKFFQNFWLLAVFIDKRRRKRSDDVDIKTEKPEASDKPKYFDEIEKDEEITTDVTLKGNFK